MSIHLAKQLETFDIWFFRYFGEIQDWTLQNTAFQAMIRFKTFMMENVESTPRPGCDPDAIFNQNVFFARTMSTSKTEGEPAAEGVHQDGVEFTMTTLLKSRNQDWDKEKSARSKLFTRDQTIGVAFGYADLNNVIVEVQHTTFLDTLLFVDNEVCHAVSPLKLINPDKTGFRDMMILFSRRMSQQGSNFISAGFDSLKSHPRLPAAFALRSKMLIEMYPQIATEMPAEGLMEN